MGAPVAAMPSMAMACGLVEPPPHAASESVAQIKEIFKKFDFFMSKTYWC
jgi:hypothetical protein